MDIRRPASVDSIQLASSIVMSPEEAKPFIAFTHSSVNKEDVQISLDFDLVCR